jgi:hypothetical protein
MPEPCGIARWSLVPSSGGGICGLDTHMSAGRPWISRVDVMLDIMYLIQECLKIPSLALNIQARNVNGHDLALSSGSHRPGLDLTARLSIDHP